MRVLFVSPVVPWPADSGGRIRTARLIEHAARRAEVHLYCVAPPRPWPGSEAAEADGSDGVAGSAEAARALAALATSVRVFPRSRPGPVPRMTRTRPERWFHSEQLQSALRAALASGDYDLVHLDELNLVRALPPPGRAGAAVPVVVHHHKLDREFLTALSAERPLRAALEVRKLARLEALAARRHHDHLACCPEDAGRLTARYPHLSVDVVPSGFDPRHFQARGGPRERDRILFLGTLSYGPNVEALTWFARAVLPGLRAARPGLCLDVVGREPGPAVRALAGPGLRLVGGVEDVRPWLARTAALVAPLRVGGGTRLKLVEALAMRTPVVATPVAAEGLGLEDGVHLDLAERSPEFAQRILLSLDQPARALARAERGRAFVAARYPWERLARLLVRSWSRVVEGPGGERAPAAVCYKSWR